MTTENEVIAQIPDAVKGTVHEEHENEIFEHKVEIIPQYATEASSKLDVNEAQHSTFKDTDNDTIEDLSEDKALEPILLDKLISDAFSGTQTDYVEEILDKNGNHMRKEVH